MKKVKKEKNFVGKALISGWGNKVLKEKQEKEFEKQKAEKGKEICKEKSKCGSSLGEKVIKDLFLKLDRDGSGDIYTFEFPSLIIDFSI